MAKELAKQYSPQDVENRIYQFWLGIISMQSSTRRRRRTPS